MPHLGKASELIFIGALTACLQTAVWPPAQADTPTPAAGTPSQASQAAPPSAWQTIESDAQDILTRQYLTGNWLGARDTLGNRGITPNVTFIQAVSGDAFGGLSTSKVDWRYRLDATLTLDMQKLCGWKGGTAYVDFLNHGGQNPQDNLVGQLQAISAIDQSPDTRLDQLWFEQTLLHKKITLKFGRIDTTYDFDDPRDSLNFLNGSFGFTPAIFVFPSYPFSAWGGEMTLQPASSFFMHVGLFDGNTSNTLPALNTTNPLAVQNPFGVFGIAEEGLVWHLPWRQFTGTFVSGQWYHSGHFDAYNQPPVNGTEGFYGYVDQTLWRAGNKPGADCPRLGAFAEYAWANDRVSLITQNVVAGLDWHALIPGRPEDDCGIGETWAALSKYAGTPRGYEAITEAFYNLQLTPWLGIQPDLQYVAAPSGGAAPDALVWTLQMQINF